MNLAGGNGGGRPPEDGRAARRAGAAQARDDDAPARRWWVADARGRRVTQLDPYALWLARRTEVIPAEELRALAHEIGLGLARGQRILFAIAAVCALIVIASVVERGVVMLVNGTFTLGGLAQASRALVAVVPGPFIFWLGARHVRHGRTTRVMLVRRRCPHCGYDLRGLPVQPEGGETLCPECGCVWNLPPPAERGPPGASGVI